MPKRGRKRKAARSSTDSSSRSSSQSSIVRLITKRFDSLDKRLARIETLVNEEYAEEEKVEANEQQELAELHKLENLEKEVEKQVLVKPFKRITYRDFTKSAIGAFFGILGHFSFFYGVELSHDISIARAWGLYGFAFFIGAIFLYTTGYKRPTQSFWFMALRLVIIYATSLLTIVIVLFLFNFASLESHAVELFKTVATISILAVMGAIAADLIGKDAE